MKSVVDTSPGASAGWLLEDYPCPECHQEICHLDSRGRCPICGAHVVAKYFGLMGRTWVPADVLDEAERRALLVEPSFVTVFGLAWIDL